MTFLRRFSIIALTLVSLALPIADARPAAAECTVTREASLVAKSMQARVRCNNRALRSGSPCVPAPPPPPGCAGSLVDDAVALAYGPNNPAASPVDRSVLRKQLACQERIGRAVSRFVGTKLRSLIAGRTREQAEARARTQIDRLLKPCAVTVTQDVSDVVLPAVGTTCQAGVLTPGILADGDALRACLVPALEVMVDEVAPSPLPRPNIVLILTDDQRWDTVGLEHSLDGVTPVMPEVEAELRASGVTFENSFVSTALCCPSRSSGLTGQYAHTTGVLTNMQPTGGAPNFDDSSSVATWLQDAGYRTGLYGKYLNGYNLLWTLPQQPYVPPGWDEWHAFRGPKFYDFVLVENGAGFDHALSMFTSGCAIYNNCPGDQGGCGNPTSYSTDVLLDRALDFLDAQPSGQPFFLYFAPYAPHGPACPAKQDEGSFSTIPPWRPPNWNETDDSDKPMWIQDLCPMPQGKQNNLDNFRKKQLESLQAVDRAVGAIMEKLRAIGQDDNTLVVFASDNGYSWGSHCHGPKRCPYEECMRVPLVMRYPLLTGPTRSETRFGVNIDLAFTFAELAGLVPPIQQDGRSLANVLRDAEPTWRTDFLYEHWLDDDEEGDPAKPPMLAGIRGLEWKYIELETGETELYNLLTDPYELQNETNNPAYADVKAELAARLRQVRPDWPPTP